MHRSSYYLLACERHGASLQIVVGYSCPDLVARFTDEPQMRTVWTAIALCEIARRRFLEYGQEGALTCMAVMGTFLWSY